MPPPSSLAHLSHSRGSKRSPDRGFCGCRRRARVSARGPRLDGHPQVPINPAREAALSSWSQTGVITKTQGARRSRKERLCGEREPTAGRPFAAWWRGCGSTVTAHDAARGGARCRSHVRVPPRSNEHAIVCAHFGRRVSRLRARRGSIPTRGRSRLDRLEREVHEGLPSGGIAPAASSCVRRGPVSSHMTRARARAATRANPRHLETASQRP